MTDTLYAITAATLTRELGTEIPDIYVVVAKHLVMGLDKDGLKEILGATSEEIAEVEADPVYKIVKNRLSGVFAEQTANQSSGWDAIENLAIEGVLKRLPFEKDGDYLLKAAAVANRAIRKNQPNGNVLDPQRAAGRTTITLTQRLVHRLNHTSQEEEREETRQVSIHSDSANPTFQEVDSLLTVKSVPALPKAISVQVHNADPSLDELERFMMDRK